MADERILAQIYGEIESLKRKAEQKTESLAYQHAGDGVPTHSASEGVFYWNYTDDDLYVNADGSTTWQIVGGASSAANHNMLSATHLDSTAASVTRGAFMVGLGASPTWTRLDHPSDVHHYIRSNSADPGWTADLTLKTGAYVGRTGDVRIKFSSGVGQIDAILGDNAGSDQFRFVDSDGTAVGYVDSNGNLYAADHAAIGGAVSSNEVLRVRELTASFAGTNFYGIAGIVIKTAGASTNADSFIGLFAQSHMSQAGGTIGDLYGADIQAQLDDGNVGDGSLAADAYAMSTLLNMDGGKVWGGAYGLRAYVDQEAGNEVVGDIAVITARGDFDGTTGGTTYLVKLEGLTNIDYGLYETGGS